MRPIVATFEVCPIGDSNLLGKSKQVLFLNPALADMFVADQKEGLLETDIRDTWADQ